MQCITPVTRTHPESSSRTQSLLIRIEEVHVTFHTRKAPSATVSLSSYCPGLSRIYFRERSCSKHLSQPSARGSVCFLILIPQVPLEIIAFLKGRDMQAAIGRLVQNKKSLRGISEALRIHGLINIFHQLYYAICCPEPFHSAVSHAQRWADEC